MGSAALTERIHLMAAGPSTHHVAETLLQLLEAAHGGRVRGLIFAAQLRGSSESLYCGSAGTLYRDPLKGLGANLLLQQELMSLIPERNVETMF